MVIATRADVDTRSIVRLPDADTSKKGYKFTDPDGEFPRVVPLPVQGEVLPAVFMTPVGSIYMSRSFLCQKITKIMFTTNKNKK